MVLNQLLLEGHKEQKDDKRTMVQATAAVS